ncbi:MAG: bifunctional phosphopantothenoylcysteine decarboxylase/phosphopantothenate--cysteine ligase CoaBC [Bacteroidota bacterium]
MLRGRNILVGVTGGIAAYKSALLVRLLVRKGASVKVVMTPSAKDFITPLTLSTLSKNPVVSDFTASADGTWNNHVELGLWADAFIIAPATANTLSKMASGNCDNLLMAVYLSARCPVYFAPAMDLDMYRHPTTRANIEKLVSFGNRFIRPNHGELASGLEGEGRMAEPEEIIAFLEKDISKRLPLSGKKALVTAGPTQEAIDPVRFIGNHSSGKMGFAIAEELARQGAEVILVCGPCALPVKSALIQRIDVTSAEQMYTQAVKAFGKAHIAVLAAAVADYKPKKAAAKKIKKTGAGLALELEPTKDIAAALGRQKKKGQIIVGFALETDNEVANAKQKLKKKNFDMIVLNSLRDPGAGFRHDTNKIKIIDRHNKTINFELKSKTEAAVDIVAEIIKRSK